MCARTFRVCCSRQACGSTFLFARAEVSVPTTRRCASITSSQRRQTTTRSFSTNSTKSLTQWNSANLAATRQRSSTRQSLNMPGTLTLRKRSPPIGSYTRLCIGCSSTTAASTETNVGGSIERQPSTKVNLNRSFMALSLHFVAWCKSDWTSDVAHLANSYARTPIVLSWSIL